MKRSTGRKVLVSAAVLGAAAAVAGLGTFGTVTSTTSASTTVSSGTVVIGLGTAGTADNRLTVASGLIVPGDTIQRQVKLNNTGNQALSQVTLGSSRVSRPSSTTSTWPGIVTPRDIPDPMVTGSARSGNRSARSGYVRSPRGQRNCVDAAQGGDRDARTQVIELDGDPDAPSRGRHAVTEVLDRWGCEAGTREDVLLVVSELVTNAVVHGAEPIVVTMVRAPERFRIEVTDGATESSPHSNPRPRADAENGRGLSVVTRLAVAWGWRASPGNGKTVWAELPLRHAS